MDRLEWNIFMGYYLKRSEISMSVFEQEFLQTIRGTALHTQLDIPSVLFRKIVGMVQNITRQAWQH